LDAVTNDVTVDLRFDAPVSPLGLSEEVPGFGKSWLPSAVTKLRIPSNVVHMEMSANHCSDVVGSKTRLTHFLHEICIEIAQCLEIWAGLVVSGTSVYNNSFVANLNAEGME
jgi:hypothetical protein